ncbi:hypothetical protein KM043_003850 [Ampulex compressa]|nr:hypothetical protein KM043_003850 [Ampulex compressa]
MHGRTGTVAGRTDASKATSTRKSSREDFEERSPDIADTLFSMPYALCEAARTVASNEGSQLKTAQPRSSRISALNERLLPSDIYYGHTVVDK